MPWPGNGHFPAFSDRPSAYRQHMADEQPKPRDYIDGWADELIEQIEESLARHAEFDRLYPEPEDATETVTP